MVVRKANRGVRRVSIGAAITLALGICFGVLKLESSPHRPPRPEPATTAVVNPNSDPLIGPIAIDGLLTPETTDTSRAHAHPHGDKVCASGCALSRHPTEVLTAEHFERLLTRLGAEPNNRRLLDEIVYFGPQVARRLDSLAADDPLRKHIPRSSITRLMRQLSRSHADVEIRVVAASGDVVAELPVQRVPLDLRHEFDLQEHAIPPLLASGTVKRVGVNRLWTRL